MSKVDNRIHYECDNCGRELNKFSNHIPHLNFELRMVEYYPVRREDQLDLVNAPKHFCSHLCLHEYVHAEAESNRDD